MGREAGESDGCVNKDFKDIKMSQQEIKIGPVIDEQHTSLMQNILDRGADLPKEMDFKEQFAKLKAELPKNQFLAKDENLKAYDDFLDEMYCREAEKALSELNEKTMVFFENGEGKQAIVEPWDPKFTAIVADVKKANGQLIEQILVAKMAKNHIDLANINEANFTEEAKTKVREEFQGTVASAQTTLVSGMERLARRDLAPASELAPTFDFQELRRCLPELNMLYGAWSHDNVAFSERFFTNLGKLSEEEKKGLSEPAIRAKEKDKKRKELVTLYLQSKREFEEAGQSNKAVDKGIQLGWVISEIQALDYNEQAKWLKDFVAVLGANSAESAIEEAIVSKTVSLGAARELFRATPKYQTRYKNLYAKMKSGELRKDLERTPLAIAESQTAQVAPDGKSGQGGQEKINAAEMLSKSPVRSILGAYGMFAGTMGIVLNLLARKDLIMSGDILGALNNPALGISLGYLGAGTEMLTAESGIGSGLISDLFGKLRGEDLDSAVSNEQIRTFAYNCRTYLDTREYLVRNFTKVKTQIDAMQEKRIAVGKQVDEGVLNQEEQGKDFVDFAMHDPEFLRDVTGLDGFNRKETIEKIVKMYVFTKFAKVPPQNEEDFKQLVAKILNPAEHMTA